MAPALGMCSRVLSMPQNLDRDSGKEQEIPGFHSLSRHTHTILQRGLKGLQPLPRNGAQGSQSFHLLHLARMLYMSIWKPQEFVLTLQASAFLAQIKTTGHCLHFLSADPSHTWLTLGLLSHPQHCPSIHLCLLCFASTS